MFSIIFLHDDCSVHDRSAFVGILANFYREGGSYRPIFGSGAFPSFGFIVASSDLAKLREYVGRDDWFDPMVLHVASGNKMETSVENMFDGSTAGLGCMCQVSEKALGDNASYLYRPDMHCYWVPQKRNPDNSFEDSDPSTSNGKRDMSVVRGRDLREQA